MAIRASLALFLRRSALLFFFLDHSFIIFIDLDRPNPWQPTLCPRVLLAPYDPKRPRQVFDPSPTHQIITHPPTFTDHPPPTTPIHVTHVTPPPTADEQQQQQMGRGGEKGASPQAAKKVFADVHATTAAPKPWESLPTEELRKKAQQFGHDANADRATLLKELVRALGWGLLWEGWDGT
jgi:hypothetical protein